MLCLLFPRPEKPVFIGLYALLPCAVFNMASLSLLLIVVLQQTVHRGLIALPVRGGGFSLALFMLL